MFCLWFIHEGENAFNQKTPRASHQLVIPGLLFQSAWTEAEIGRGIGLGGGVCSHVCLCAGAIYNLNHGTDCEMIEKQ